MLLVQCVFLILCPISILSITLQIDGEIDLGPNWNYEYRPSTVEDNDNFQSYLRTLKTEKPENEFNKIISNDVHTIMNQNNSTNHKTQVNDHSEKPKRKRRPKEKKNVKESLDHDNIDLEVPKSPKRTKKMVTRVIETQSVEFKSHKVRDDTKVYDFIVHIFKQTLKVFDDIKKKTNDLTIKKKIATLKRDYEDKFGYYLSQTYNHTLKTKLGTQKIVLNTIDASNKLLQRVINDLSQDIDKDFLRSDGTISVFQKEINREKDLEMKHACKKLGICRQNEEFSDFLVEILMIVLQTDDRKLKQAADALTEVLKEIDYDNSINYDLQMKMKRHFEKMEYWDTFMFRTMFLLLKNLVKHKNNPILVMNPQDNYLANKTVAFQDLVNMCNEKLPKADHDNAWQKIKNDATAWKEGKNNNAKLIVEDIFKHIKENVLDKLDYAGKKKFNKSIEVLMSHL